MSRKSWYQSKKFLALLGAVLMDLSFALQGQIAPEVLIGAVTAKVAVYILAEAGVDKHRKDLNRY